MAHAIKRFLTSQNRKKLVESYFKKRLRSSGMPAYLVIEATNRCNLDCIMCPRSEMNRHLGSMDMRLFEKIIDQVRLYVDFIYLHFFGESLLHEHIADMIEYCGAKGLTTGLSTNITLLDRNMAATLLNSKLSFMVLSCDGFDRDTYERARRGADFQRILKNMESFKEEKMQVGNSGPKIVIQSIAFPDMPEDYEEKYRRFWKDYGADSVVVKSFHPWAYQSEKVNEYAPHCVFEPKGVCMEPWRGMAVYWDGAVVPCCNDFSGKEILGDLTCETVREVWNGKKYRDFRQMHVSGMQSKSSLCRKCPYPVESVENCRRKTSYFRPSSSEFLYYGVKA